MYSRKNSAKVRVAVVGAGRWGKNLVRVFARSGCLAAVVDPDPAAREIAALYSVPHLTDCSELRDHRDVTAAAIATPAATHSHVALRCLDLGLDLFIEKPVAVSVEDAELVVAEAERRGRILFVGHLLLYHPAVVALKAMMSRGELGEIRYIYSNRLNLGRVRREENILWSFAPHDIAVILHLLDAFPISVGAVGGSWLQNGIADVTVTHLAFPENIRAHVFVSWLHPAKEQKLVVVGSQRTAIFDDMEETEKLRVIDASVEVPADGIPSTRAGSRRAVPVATDEPLQLEIEHFVRACSNRTRPLTDGPHGIEVLKILAAAEASLRRTDAAQGIDPRTLEPRRLG